MTLHVPEISPDDSTLTAALKYAAAGWYVLPVDQGTKRPAAELGNNWGLKSSRDMAQITAWFAGTSYGIGLHVGRSGAVAFDVDHPDRLPSPLRRAVNECHPPHQRTRIDDPDRGHYLFTFHAGRILGNGTGQLGGAWGEIRGRGGQIVAAPTPHAAGGHYHWHRTGPVPQLPTYLDELLHTATAADDTATDSEVLGFLDAYAKNSRPELLDAWVQTFQQKIAEGESRHDRMISIVAGAFSEARAGYFPSRQAMERLENAFLTAVTREPLPGSRQGPARASSVARSEWMGISAWGVAQAHAANLGQIHARVEEKMPDPADVSWIPAPTPGVDPATGEIHTSPDMFFDKRDGFLALQLAKAVLATGPIATDHGGVLYSYASGVWNDDGERVIRGRVTELLQDRYRMVHAATVTDMLRGRPPAFDDNWDTRYLNLPNGLLDWHTGQLHPHDPAVPSITRIPIEWDPTATCPEIDKWITEVFPTDAREFVEEVIGYCLLNDNPLHKAILLFGRGRNGKGSFLRLLKTLVGDRNTSAVTPQSLDDNRFRAAELRGKLANLVGDVDPRIFKATETFKQVTGGDLVTAERKYGQPFRFYCRALLVAAFNALPRSSDTSEGFFSRWLVVPFTGYFPPGVADPSREDKMHSPAELRGLLVLAARGLTRLMERRGFDLPPSVEAETAGFRRVADPVRAFLDDYIPALSVEWTPRSEVYRDYHQWAITNGYSTMSAAGFYERVEASAHDLPDHVTTPRVRQGTRGYLFTARVQPPCTHETAGHTAQGAEGAANPHSLPCTHTRGGKGVEPAPSAPEQLFEDKWPAGTHGAEVNST